MSESIRLFTFIECGIHEQHYWNQSDLFFVLRNVPSICFNSRFDLAGSESLKRRIIYSLIENRVLSVFRSFYACHSLHRHHLHILSYGPCTIKTRGRLADPRSDHQPPATPNTIFNFQYHETCDATRTSSTDTTDTRPTRLNSPTSIAMAGLNYVAFNQDHSLLAVGTCIALLHSSHSG
jgi:hypothetical protein